jgi:membrane protein
MFFGASGVFGQLQSSLNKIWDVQPHKRRRGIQGQLRKRASAFAMILFSGFLLFLSLAASTALSVVHGFIDQRFPIAGPLLPLANFTLSFAVITLLFAMILKMLPEIKIEWSDVWLGALVTSLLFSIGKALIGMYLGRAGVTSVYGAAGSLVLVLLWIYYSAQLLFLGAEFTEVYSRRFGSRKGEVE